MKSEENTIIQEFRETAKSPASNRFFTEFSTEEIKEAFLAEHGGDRPSEQIISICDAVFDLIDANDDDIPQHLIGPLFHLQKSFRVYKNMLDKAESDNLQKN